VKKLKHRIHEVISTEYKKNRYFYVKLLLSRTLDFLYAFCGTDITVGAQYAALTLSSCPGASIFINKIIFLSKINHSSIFFSFWATFNSFILLLLSIILQFNNSYD
jgi:hypothetical protein